MKRDVVGEEPFGRSRARPMKLRPPLALEMVRPAALFPLPATNGKDGGRRTWHSPTLSHNCLGAPQ